MKALCLLSPVFTVADFYQKKKTLNLTGGYFVHGTVKELLTAVVETMEGANLPVKQLSSISYL